jgi:hypothetical protein
LQYCFRHCAFCNLDWGITIYYHFKFKKKIIYDTRLNLAFIQIIKFPNFKKNICLHWFFFFICLDIIGRVKISEYNFLCPFLSQGFTFFFRFSVSKYFSWN